MPKRIQRRRTKGWKLPPNAVCVSRPSFYGNPFKVDGTTSVEQAVMDYRIFMEFSMEQWPGLRDKIRRELGGKDLCCWCRLDQECHATVLLEIANSR
jgi:hypothetical protein